MSKAMNDAYDYGKSGHIGVATPQSNPTVEAEFGILYPRSVSIQATRLTSSETDPLARLREYLIALDTTLKSYGSLPLSAFGFACTGSSYLLGADHEDAMTHALSEKAGFPIETAARAILARIEAQSIKSVSLIMPYPDALIDAAVRYWESRGIKVMHAHRVLTRTSDTLSIYELSSADAQRAIENFDTNGSDAILLSGTGMPTLNCLAQVSAAKPVLSSNFCLAWQLLRLAAAHDLLTEDGMDIGGWRDRHAECMTA